MSWPPAVFQPTSLGAHHLLRGGVPKLYHPPMTDKQAVIDALQRLPEDASIEEITEELRIMAAIRRGRADIAAGQSRTQEQAERKLESWATAWISR